MLNINDLTEFFGWCLVINIVILSIMTLALSLFKNSIVNVHSKFLGMDPSGLPTIYVNYLANYKLGITLISLVPYLALKLMG